MPRRRIIDLTLPLYTGMPVYPGDPEASIELVHTIARNGWDMRRLEINAHDGTHVNVPAHMIAGGKTLDDYSLSDFCGGARLYAPQSPMSPEEGVLFAGRNIDEAMVDKIKKARPKFIGLARDFEFELAILRDLLADGIVSFERLANLDKLPARFEFYAMPLNIRGGDGSPVRAFAVIDG
jgi:arylformamidase